MVFLNWKNSDLIEMYNINNIRVPLNSLHVPLSSLNTFSSFFISSILIMNNYISTLHNIP